jgi:hypothetical protein
MVLHPGPLDGETGPRYAAGEPGHALNVPSAPSETEG